MLTELLKFQRDWNKENIALVLSEYYQSDKEAILEFFTAVGTSDLNGQSAVCKKAICQANELLNEANKQFDKKAKMYRSLGFCAGLAAVIFFI